MRLTTHAHAHSNRTHNQPTRSTNQPRHRATSRGDLHLHHQGALPRLQDRQHRRLGHLPHPLPPVSAFFGAGLGGAGLGGVTPSHTCKHACKHACMHACMHTDGRTQWAGWVGAHPPNHGTRTPTPTGTSSPGSAAAPRRQKTSPGSSSPAATAPSPWAASPVRGLVNSYIGRVSWGMGENKGRVCETRLAIASPVIP